MAKVETKEVEGYPPEFQDNLKSACSEKSWKIRMLNIIFVSVGFLVIFVSFNTTENFMTSLYGNYGMISLCSIYISFAVFGLVVPLIIRRIGEKWTLVIGGICIVPFLLMNVFANVYLLIAMSLFVGFGQSVLWCAQGSLLTRCSKPEKRGRNSGVFFFIYQLNQSVGNGFAYVMTLSGLKLVYLFIIFTCLCVVGIIPFLLVRMGVLPDIERVSIKSDLRNLWKVFKSPIMLLLLPLFIYSGISQCFIYGELTAMFGIDWVSIAMCIFGTVNMVVSLVFGKISDTLGRIPILSIASFVMVMGLFAIVLHFFLGIEELMLLFVAVICVGIADAGYNTQIDILIGRYFPFESDAAFAGFYSTQSFTSGMGFPIFMGLSSVITSVEYYRLTQAIFLVVLMGLSFLSLFFLNRKEPIEKKN